MLPIDAHPIRRESYRVYLCGFSMRISVSLIDQIKFVAGVKYCCVNNSLCGIAKQRRFPIDVGSCGFLGVSHSDTQLSIAVTSCIVQFVFVVYDVDFGCPEVTAFGPRWATHQSPALLSPIKKGFASPDREVVTAPSHSGSRVVKLAIVDHSRIRAVMLALNRVNVPHASRQRIQQASNKKDYPHCQTDMNYNPLLINTSSQYLRCPSNLIKHFAMDPKKPVKNTDCSQIVGGYWIFLRQCQQVQQS